MGGLVFQGTRAMWLRQLRGATCLEGLESKRAGGVVWAQRGQLFSLCRDGGWGSSCSSASCVPDVHPAGCCAEDSQGVDERDYGMVQTSGWTGTVMVLKMRSGEM